MPKKLKKFEFTRGSANYDWEKWLDGNVWKLEIEKDFNASVKIFRAAFSSQCSRHNLVGRTQIVEDGKYLVIQARPKGGKVKVCYQNPVKKKRLASKPK